MRRQGLFDQALRSQVGGGEMVGDTPKASTGNKIRVKQGGVAWQ